MASREDDHEQQEEEDENALSLFADEELESKWMREADDYYLPPGEVEEEAPVVTQPTKAVPSDEKKSGGRIVRKVREVTSPSAADKTKVFISDTDKELKAGTLVRTRGSNFVYVCETASFMQGATFSCAISINRTVRKNWQATPGELIELEVVDSPLLSVHKSVTVDVDMQTATMRAPARGRDLLKVSALRIANELKAACDKQPLLHGQQVALRFGDHVAWCACSVSDSVLRLLSKETTLVSVQSISWQGVQIEL